MPAAGAASSAAVSPSPSASAPKSATARSQARCTVLSGASSRVAVTVQLRRTRSAAPATPARHAIRLPASRVGIPAGGCPARDPARGPECEQGAAIELRVPVVEAQLAVALRGEPPAGLDRRLLLPPAAPLLDQVGEVR